MANKKVAEAVKKATNAQIELAPCPCGQTPDELMLELPAQPVKYGRAIGTCCGVWGIEFFNAYQAGEDTVRLAKEAWNRAVRG